MVADFKDGCRKADARLGRKSSCSECPFVTCILSREEAARDDEQVMVNRVVPECDEVVLSEAELRKNLRDKISRSFALDGLFSRWLPDAPKLYDFMFQGYSSKSTPDEFWVRRSIKDIISLGGDLYCFECGLKLTRADDVYRRRYSSLNYQVWCEFCCIREVLAVLALRLRIGNWVIKKRSYERIWRAKV